MSEPSTEMPHTIYCWMDRARKCGADCVAFDRNGAMDTTGEHTSCLLCNQVDGVCRALISIARNIDKTQKSKLMPGANVPPPPVGGK